MSHHRAFKERTPCEKFVARVLGNWSGLGDTEGHNRNIYMSALRITHNPREPGNIGSAIMKSQTSDPDDRVALNFAAFLKCMPSNSETGEATPKDIALILHHQSGSVEIVKGQVENDEGTAVTMQSEDRDSTGNSNFLLTQHRWFFDQKRMDDHRSSTTSLRMSNALNNDRHVMPRPSVTGAKNGTSNDSTYVDNEVLMRQFWVATQQVPRLELIQRTKFTTAHHIGGDPNRMATSQLSGNAAFY